MQFSTVTSSIILPTSPEAYLCEDVMAPWVCKLRMVASFTLPKGAAYRSLRAGGLKVSVWPMPSKVPV